MAKTKLTSQFFNSTKSLNDLKALLQALRKKANIIYQGGVGATSPSLA